MTERIGTHAQVQQMKKVRSRILDLLVREFKDNTESAVMAGACMQVIVGLLNKYPADVRQALAEGMIMILKGEKDDEAPLIIQPGRPN